jgi:serine/threonine-protein kinase
VAIKVLHAQYAERPDIVERFEREAELGIKLDHPGIVRVHELAVDSGRVALIMELVEGRPLSQMIGTETGPIPWPRAEPLFRQLVSAVGYAHDHGVIHRDLKPENIIIGPDGQLKVLDFGIAKDVSSGRTQTGTGMGTIDYMAPEQYLDAKAVDGRADIYALGMTLYEMLSGQLPWPDSTTEFTILDRKRNGDIPPPTKFYPDIPSGVVNLVMRMLAPTLEERPPSIEGLSQELEKVLETPGPSLAASALATHMVWPDPGIPAVETPSQTSSTPPAIHNESPPSIEETSFTLGRFFLGTIRVFFYGIGFIVPWAICLNIVQEASRSRGLIGDSHMNAFMIIFLAVLVNGPLLVCASWFRDPPTLHRTARMRFHLNALVMTILITPITIGEPDVGAFCSFIGVIGSIVLARKSAFLARAKAREQTG